MRDTMDDPATRAGLLGVFASHVLPRLDIQDLRALGQCCTELRHLVHRDLPFSTWRSVSSPISRHCPQADADTQAAVDNPSLPNMLRHKAVLPLSI